MAPHCCLIPRLRPPPTGEVSGVSPDSLYLLASNGSQQMLNQGISKLVFTINLAYLTLSTFSACLFIYLFISYSTESFTHPHCSGEMQAHFNMLSSPAPASSRNAFQLILLLFLLSCYPPLLFCLGFR